MSLRKERDEILFDHNLDGIDQRGFLKCMAWAGTGALCVLEGGVLKSYGLDEPAGMRKAGKGDFSFVQISDSHMGFNKAANPDVVATFKAAIEKINALPVAPEFILHTGDITHLSKPSEFDTVDQLLQSAPTKDLFFVPASMMCWRITANNILSATARMQKARAGTASTRTACTSSDSSM